MAGVFNKTQRQFNLKLLSPSGSRLTVRLVPGMNEVDDKVWSQFLDPLDPQLERLKKQRLIDFGQKQDAKLVDEDFEDEVVKSKTKSEVKPGEAELAKKKAKEAKKLEEDADDFDDLDDEPKSETKKSGETKVDGKKSK